MTTALPLLFSTKTVLVLQGIIVLIKLLLHMSSPVHWGHSAMHLVCLTSTNAVPVLAVTTVMNLGRPHSPGNVMEVSSFLAGTNSRVELFEGKWLC